MMLDNEERSGLQWTLIPVTKIINKSPYINKKYIRNTWILNECACMEWMLLHIRCMYTYCSAWRIYVDHDMHMLKSLHLKLWKYNLKMKVCACFGAAFMQNVPSARNHLQLHLILKSAIFFSLYEFEPLMQKVSVCASGCRCFVALKCCFNELLFLLSICMILTVLELF